MVGDMFFFKCFFMVYRDEGGMIYDEEIEPVFEPGSLGDSPN